MAERLRRADDLMMPPSSKDSCVVVFSTQRSAGSKVDFQGIPCSWCQIIVLLNHLKTVCVEIESAQRLLERSMSHPAIVGIVFCSVDLHLGIFQLCVANDLTAAERRP